MPQRDSAAVGIDVRRIVLHPQLPQDGECLRREGLVQLDHVHIVDGELCLGQDFACRRNGAHAHDARRYSGHR